MPKALNPVDDDAGVPKALNPVDDVGGPKASKKFVCC